MRSRAVDHGYSGYEGRLSRIVGAGIEAHLGDCLVGLEKEGLRVSPAGTVSLRPHPAAFGSALTHPYITTDRN